MPTTNNATKIAVGCTVRVKDGVNSPDFSEISFGGWTGTVVEITSKKPPMKLLVEWDNETLDGMPEEYVANCEQQQLFYRMACLSEDDLDPLD